MLRVYGGGWRAGRRQTGGSSWEAYRFLVPDKQDEKVTELWKDTTSRG